MPGELERTRPARASTRADASYAGARAPQRMLRRLGASRPGSWLFARVLHRIDRPMFRLTRGRHTLASLATGLPVVMLTTTGARSGRKRTVPVLGLPTGYGLVVIASNYGGRRHPGWYHNLRADPDAEVSVGGRLRRVHAREAEREQRDEIWRIGLSVYPGWAEYERRAPGRRIAAFVLEPR